MDQLDPDHRTLPPTRSPSFLPSPQYPGQHEAIIDEPTFDRIQAMLNDKASNRRSETNVTQPHLLTGLLLDETGDRMSPTHAAKNGRRYRYYISHRLMQAHRKEKDGWRLPAQQIESIVLNEITGLLRNKAKLLDMCGLANCDPETARQAIASGAAMAEQLETGTMEAKREQLQQIIHRITLQPDAITIEVDRAGLAIGIEMDREEATAETGEDVREPHSATIRLPIQLRRRGVEARLVLTDAQHQAPDTDPNLIRLLGQAHFLANQLTSGKAKSITELANATGSNAAEISRILPLAFLAPEIVRDILEGRQPVELTAKRLSRLDYLPITWKDQRSLLGF